MKFKTACLAASMAAAGLATAGMAHAQSSVTLYGLVDVNVEVHNNSADGQGGNKTVAGMRSGGQSGSRWGLRGSEDLGNGLKAIFQLESGFNVNDGYGDGRLFQRTAMGGLAGNWGELTFGRQYTSSFNLTGQFVPFRWGSLYEPINRFVPVRVDNAIKYRGKFAGADLSGYYGFSDTTSQVVNDDDVTGTYGAALSYKFGAFSIVGGYDHANEMRTVGVVTTGKMNNYLVGARVDIGQFNVTGVYRRRNQDMPLGNDQRSNLYSLGLGYQVSGAAGLELAYYREHFKEGQLAGMTDDTWQQVALRGTYALSKRTNLYAVVAHSIDGPLALSQSSFALAAGKDNQTGGAIGIRHLF